MWSLRGAIYTCRPISSTCPFHTTTMRLRSSKRTVDQAAESPRRSTLFGRAPSKVKGRDLSAGSNLRVSQKGVERFGTILCLDLSASVPLWQIHSAVSVTSVAKES